LFGHTDLPDSGDIIALDAEFVSVQEEETMLGDSGNKIVLRETRHALGRVSVIDCRTGKIIIDDHVLPKEPVFDYLTRFSGIVEGDLDPKTSPHHLVTARTAYLKLRLLMERYVLSGRTSVSFPSYFLALALTSQFSFLLTQWMYLFGSWSVH
jgi:PAB-dependent poly(A)-specific ribonuclease subunit 2